MLADLERNADVAAKESDPVGACSPSTNASYRKEAERWLLWCILERRKAMSSANVHDCLA